MTHPPTRLERFKALVGDLARPLTIITAALASSYAVITIARAIGDALRHDHGTFEGAAIFIGAVLAGVGAIYIGKSVENANIAKHKASVETAAINAAPPGNVSMAPTPPNEVAITPDDGELPEAERVK